MQRVRSLYLGSAFANSNSDASFSAAAAAHAAPSAGYSFGQGADAYGASPAVRRPRIWGSLLALTRTHCIAGLPVARAEARRNVAVQKPVAGEGEVERGACPLPR